MQLNRPQNASALTLLVHFYCLLCSCKQYTSHGHCTMQTGFVMLQLKISSIFHSDSSTALSCFFFNFFYWCKCWAVAANWSLSYQMSKKYIYFNISLFLYQPSSSRKKMLLAHPNLLRNVSDLVFWKRFIISEFEGWKCDKNAFWWYWVQHFIV